VLSHYSNVLSRFAPTSLPANHLLPSGTVPLRIHSFAGCPIRRICVWVLGSPDESMFLLFLCALCVSALSSLLPLNLPRQSHCPYYNQPLP